jgi:APA family basic amino acid/polyamine antiporter
LFLALVISTALYVVVSVSAVSVLGVAGVAESARPIADVVTARLGSVGGDVAAVLAIVATSSTVLLALTAATRMIWALADGGHLPPRLAVIRRGDFPPYSLAAVTFLAACLVMVRDLKVLAAATDALVYLMFIVTNVVLIVLRRKMPDAPRPFRIPITVGRVPLPAVAGLIVTLVLAARLELDAILWATGLVSVGAVYRIVVARVASDNRP